ncbi:hypothetical protein F5876DRAFT_70802 [Lentinula aff. lateritia]|uniref:Uncharacterized protein n=1 Tax=Lentinula aff. lateritia TaxID=2804960 RepID=A0ACC1THN7_9AGAR|nr:hypothetical protein F5876DRAFT_70802 [Lentinula aff. lateritia]
MSLQKQDSQPRKRVDPPKSAIKHGPVSIDINANDTGVESAEEAPPRKKAKIAPVTLHHGSQYQQEDNDESESSSGNDSNDPALDSDASMDNSQDDLGAGQHLEEERKKETLNALVLMPVMTMTLSSLRRDSCQIWRLMASLNLWNPLQVTGPFILMAAQENNGWLFQKLWLVKGHKSSNLSFLEFQKWCFLLPKQFKIHACIQDFSSGIKDNFPTKELDGVWKLSLEILNRIQERNHMKYHRLMHNLYIESFGAVSSMHSMTNQQVYDTIDWSAIEQDDDDYNGNGNHDGNPPAQASNKVNKQPVTAADTTNEGSRIGSML